MSAPEQAPPPPPPAPPPVPEDDSPSTWQPWLYVKLALVGCLIAYVVAFIVENTHRIKVDFVFADENVHLIWVMLILVGLGIVFGVLLSQLYRHRRREKLVERARKQADPVPDLGGGDEAEGKTG